MGVVSYTISRNTIINIVVSQTIKYNTIGNIVVSHTIRCNTISNIVAPDSVRYNSIMGSVAPDGGISQPLGNNVNQIANNFHDFIIGDIAPILSA